MSPVDFARRVGSQPLALLPSFAAMPYEPHAPEPLGLTGGVAVIPVMGPLFPGDYATITSAFAIAVDDDDVDAITLLIDSPGGTVTGCFDLADAIFACRGVKPIRAILAGDAYSAAYALASACDRVTVPRTGGVGSVGIIALHMDMSENVAKAGIKPTIFRSAARKDEMNELQPLSDAARREVQAQIDDLGTLFVETVARNRRMTTAAVKATEAAAFPALEGVRVGFADAVASPDAEFIALLQSVGSPGPIATTSKRKNR